MEQKVRSAIVTGGASGIGLACAKGFAGAGLHVAIADIDFEKAAAAVKEISAMGHKTIAVRMDVTNEEEVNNGFAECIETFGGLDILVSNAGVQIVHPFEDYPFDDWKTMQGIHADGAFLTSRAAYKHMKENGGGKIIFMGSVHSYEVSPLKAAYCFAKHGVLGLCRVIALEGAAYNIHAYTICPGFVRTALAEKQIPEQAQKLNITEDEVVRNVMLKNTIDGQFTSLDDVARTVLFVADDISGSFSGQSFLVSHGWCMK